MPTAIRTALLLASTLFASTAVATDWHRPPIFDVSLKLLGRYQSGQFAQGAAEVVAHDPKTQRLFVVNAADVTVDVLDIRDPRHPAKIGALDASSLGASANSVAVSHGVVAVAIEANDRQADGVVAFYDAKRLTLLNVVGVGALPDMVTFTPDGDTVLVANEGEPNDSYTVDPEGSISVIDISRGVHRARVRTADFRRFNDDRARLLAKGVRLFGPNATVARDLEPEYIALSDDGRHAWVSLQEANAFALLDVRHAKVIDILPLGTKDHQQTDNALDASNRDGAIQIRNWPVSGLYLPDTIQSYRFRGRTYIVSANEGDSRDYDGFSEEERVNGVTLDPAAFPDAATLRRNENLGRLKITNTLGDFDGDGDFDALFSFGGRSFSIWSDDGKLVFDSGADFERIIAERLPGGFNSDNEENGSFDSRSDDKGPEPEAVAIGEVLGRTYAFIGLERIGGIMIYDITDPRKAAFVDYVNDRNFDVPACLDTNGDGDCDASNPEAGDLGPESIVFVPAHASPNHRSLVIVGNEISGTTSIYQVDLSLSRRRFH